MAAGGEDRETFGRELRAARKAKGMTQTDLANLVGVSQPAIAGYELATSAPGVQETFALENALEVKPGALSKHLGFLPAEALRGGVSSVRRAIEEDPALDPADRKALLATYERLRR